MCKHESLTDPALPQWLQSVCSPELPSSWEPLTCAFLRLAEARFQDGPPEILLVCFDVVGTGLRIRFAGRPELPAPRSARLREIADHFETLVRQSSASTGQPGPPRVSALTTEVEAVAGEISAVVPHESPFGRLPLDIDDGANVFEGVTVAATCRRETPVHVFTGLSSRHSTEDRVAGRDEDTSKRLKELMRRMRARGATRPFRLPLEDWQERLLHLEVSFPNFAEVIQSALRPHLYMLSRGLLHRMHPIALIGEPGVGKTRFARELQQILDVPAVFLTMASETNGSSLSGSSTFWANSSPGKVFELVAWGDADSETGGVANALVIVDEADKTDAGRYDPMGALYALLEQETAARFEDQSVPGLTCDMQHLRFVLTANDAFAIPEPLRSRVRTFQISLPDAEQARTIARQIYAALRERYDLGLATDLPACVLDEIAGLSPRETRIRLDVAMSMAAAEGKHSVDLATWHRTRSTTMRRNARIGFR